VQQNAAVTVWSELIVTVQVPVPLQPPPDHLSVKRSLILDHPPDRCRRAKNVQQDTGPRGTSRAAHPMLIAAQSNKGSGAFMALPVCRDRVILVPIR
jgi:hypothetical protein